MRRTLVPPAAAVLLTFALALAPAARADVGRWSSGGPWGGEVNAILVDPVDAARVGLATWSGVWRTVDAGASWTRVAAGPRGTAALVRDGDAVWAAGLGLWRSSDGGASFVAIPGAPAEILCLDARGGLVLVGSADGLARSADGGAHWQKIASVGSYVGAVAIDPVVPQRAWAISNGGTFRSTDGGLTWQHVAGDAPPPGTSELFADPRDGSVWAASAYSGAYRSTDGGLGWHPVAKPLAGTYSLAGDPTHPTRVLAATTTGVWGTTDHGASWSPLGLPGERIGVVARHAGGRLWAGGQTSGAWRADGGAWIHVDTGLRAMPVYQFAGTPERVWAVLLGDLAISTDGGGSWTPRSAGLENAGGPWDIVVDSANPQRVWVGTNSGPYRSLDGGASWLPPTTNVTSNHLARDPASGQLFSGWYGEIVRSTDQGATWQPFSSGLPAGVKLRAMAVRTGVAVWAATADGVYRSQPVGSAWLPTATQPAATVDSLAVGGDGTLWGWNGDHLVASTDGGDHWSAASAPANDVASVAVDAGDADRLYAASYEHGIWRSRDRGQHWEPMPAEGLDVATPFTVASIGGTTWVGGTGGAFARTPGCAPDATTLCLDGAPGDRRFRVTLHYATAQNGGLAGDAAAKALAPVGVARGGVLSFGDGTNPEVLVKVLDGCALNDRFWVFAAATTTLGFDLRVEDTFAETTRVYANADHHAANPVVDTAAFATCALDGPANVADATPATTTAAADAGDSFAESEAFAAVAPLAGAPCVPGAKRLCIDGAPGDRRFEVKLHYDTKLGGGASGDALATRLAPLGIARGGVLSFGDASNPEVLVKVLDGCAVNGRRWVFAAATTTVGFTLTVTDTATGKAKSWTNPDQHTAATITDTAALACSAP